MTDLDAIGAAILAEARAAAQSARRSAGQRYRRNMEEHARMFSPDEMRRNVIAWNDLVTQLQEWRYFGRTL